MPEKFHSYSKLSRRSALKMGAAGCTSALIATSAAANPFVNQPNCYDQWQTALDQDIRLIGKSFSPDASFRPVKLHLVEVVQKKTRTQNGRQLPTTLREHAILLRFEADMNTKLESASYRLHHPSMGPLDLFINEVISPPESNVRTFESIIG